MMYSRVRTISFWCVFKITFWIKVIKTAWNLHSACHCSRVGVWDHFLAVDASSWWIFMGVFGLFELIMKNVLVWSVKYLQMHFFLIKKFKISIDLKKFSSFKNLVFFWNLNSFLTHPRNFHQIFHHYSSHPRYLNELQQIIK